MNGFVPAKFSEGCLLNLGKVGLGWFRLSQNLVNLDPDINLLRLAEVFEGLLCRLDNFFGGDGLGGAGQSSYPGTGRWSRFS